MNLAATIASLVFSFGALANSFFPFLTEPQLSAQIPAATAVFETSLAAPINSSATSMTLTANEIRGGGALSGYNCFTIDEGSSQAEFVCGTVSGTAVTSMTRGLSHVTGTTTDSDVQFSHRRGASVKITDFPIIQVLKALANGEDDFPNPLVYDGIATSTLATNRDYIPSVGLLQDTAFNGASVISATTLARGVSELSTGAEAAASTANGGSGPLVLPASLATSTRNSLTAANVVPVTGSLGLIDPAFIFNAISYTFTPVMHASGTAWTTDGNGLVRGVFYNRGINASSTTMIVTSSNATSTILQGTIPANTLGANDAITVKSYVAATIAGGSNNFWFAFGYGTGTTTCSIVNHSGSAVGRGGILEATIRGRGTNAQTISISFQGNGSTTPASTASATGQGCVDMRNSTIDTSVAQSILLEFNLNAGGSATATPATLEVLRW